MKGVFWLLLVIPAVYIVGWTALYFWVMGSDLRFFWEYLRLSWTGPGEIPAFLQATSLIIAGLVALIVLVWLKARG